MPNTFPSRTPFHHKPSTRQTLEKLSVRSEKIHSILVGDPEMGHVGLVQQVKELYADQQKTAEILDRALIRIETLERDYKSSAEALKSISEQTEEMRRSSRDVKVAVAVIVSIGTLLSWLLNSGILKALMHAGTS